LASVILEEKMTRIQWLSLFVALCGVLILSDIDWRYLDLNKRQVSIRQPVGSPRSSAVRSTTFSQRLLRRFTSFEVLVLGYFLAVMVSLPLLVWVGPLTITRSRDIRSPCGSVMVLSVLSWGIAMVLWMFLLKRLDVSQASVSVYLLPFLGVLISAITLGEKITPTMIVGGLMTLAGTVLITTCEAASP
jgi:drug/metabolite transporter (DMT)-like permease